MGEKYWANREGAQESIKKRCDNLVWGIELYINRNLRTKTDVTFMFNEPHSAKKILSLIENLKHNNQVKGEEVENQLRNIGLFAILDHISRMDNNDVLAKQQFDFKYKWFDETLTRALNDQTSTSTSSHLTSTTSPTQSWNTSDKQQNQPTNGVEILKTWGYENGIWKIIAAERLKDSKKAQELLTLIWDNDVIVAGSLHRSTFEYETTGASASIVPLNNLYMNEDGKLYIGSTLTVKYKSFEIINIKKTWEKEICITWDKIFNNGQIIENQLFSFSRNPQLRK